MSLKVAKTIKALTQLTATLLGFYSVANGADPGMVFMIVGAILVGPEVVETVALDDEE